MKQEIDKMELKKIPSDAQLVILDFFNTLVFNTLILESKERRGELRLRDGAFNLLVRLRLKGIRTAVSSSSPLEEISQVFRIPEIYGIKPFLNGVYGKEHTFEEQGQKYKNLGQICQDLKVQIKRAVFIGDEYNVIDTRSAERFNIPLIILRDFKYNLTQLIEIQKK